MAVHELEHLALGDDVGRVGEHLQHAHAVNAHHHLEGARVDEIAHQHARGVAEERVGGGSAAPQRRLVHDVVVEQRGGVNEFDDRGELVVVAAAVAEGAGGKQHERGPQALAAAADDVLGHLADEGHVRVQPRADDLVHRAHVGGDEFTDGVDRHGGKSRQKAAMILESKARR